MCDDSYYIESCVINLYKGKEQSIKTLVGKPENMNPF